MRTRKYGEGESVPKGVCRHCKKRRVTRSGMGTCGRRACLAEENAQAMSGHYGDRYESGATKKVKIDGRGKAMPVVGSKTIKGTHCYIINTGHGRMSVPIERCDEQ